MVFLQQILMYNIFLETSGQIQLTGGDTKYHEHHQEDQEFPLSTRMFLMAFFATNTMYHIFLETSGEIS